MANRQPHGERRYLSPVQVARTLGVSETTVKRWVDEGRLPAQRTPGGHRRILASEVRATARRENWPLADPSLLEGPPAEVVDEAALRQQMYQSLLTNDARQARALVLNAWQGGMSMPALADEVIAPVMAQVGQCWAAGEIDVFQEHHGTQVCLSALLALKAEVESLHAPDASRPLAIGGGPEVDHYILANLLVELTLRELGWRVVNIGPNTPFASFRRAVGELRPRLLWLSCSHLADEEAFLAGYKGLYQEAARAGVLVSVGGRALTEPVRQRMTFTHYGDRLTHLAAFVGTLLPGAGEAGP